MEQAAQWFGQHDVNQFAGGERSGRLDAIPVSLIAAYFGGRQRVITQLGDDVSIGTAGRAPRNSAGILVCRAHRGATGANGQTTFCTMVEQYFSPAGNRAGQLAHSIPQDA